MCERFAKLFIECMKKSVKEDKCKKEFEQWDQCYKKAYLKEFFKFEKKSGVSTIK